MLKANQPDGFDCPGCAWGDPEHGSSFEFCENGVKAVAWEATTARVSPDFFAAHTVSELRSWSDYDLEHQGRLTTPMRYNPETDHYEPLSWGRAFAGIAEALNGLDHPDRAEFYTSGRASNEAAFLYQTFVRLYGTNNFPDCSNMCHEASGVALTEAIGIGKGTVQLEDFEKADLIFVVGQNPGTNHPRMLADLRRATERGARVVVFNTLEERGLRRFADPQNRLEMLSAGSGPTSTDYYRPRLGGDMAIFRGMAKVVFARAGGGSQRQAKTPFSILPSSRTIVPALKITRPSLIRHRVGADRESVRPLPRADHRGCGFLHCRQACDCDLGHGHHAAQAFGPDHSRNGQLHVPARQYRAPRCGPCARCAVIPTCKEIAPSASTRRPPPPC